MKSILKSNWLKLILAGILLILFYKSVDNLNNIFSFFGTFLRVARPCIYGAVIALFAYVPVRKLETVIKKVKVFSKPKLAKMLSIFLVYVSVIVILSFAVKFIIPVLYKNVEELITKLPGYIAHLNKLTAHISFLPEFNLGFFGEQVLKLINLERLNEYLSIVTGVANSFVTFFVSVIISIYIILEKDSIKLLFRRIHKCFRIGNKSDIFVRYIKKIVSLFRSYFTGLFLDSVLIGVICTIVFMIFKVPYAVFLGLVIAIGNMIPFFGPIVAAVVVYLIAMISLGPVNALWLLIFQLIMGQIDGNIIQPKIVGSQVGVSPLAVLVSVTIFGGLFGPIGMILGVPVCASAKLVLEDYLADGRIDGKDFHTTQ